MTALFSRDRNSSATALPLLRVPPGEASPLRPLLLLLLLPAAVTAEALLRELSSAQEALSTAMQPLLAQAELPAASETEEEEESTAELPLLPLPLPQCALSAERTSSRAPEEMASACTALSLADTAASSCMQALAISLL